MVLNYITTPSKCQNGKGFLCCGFDLIREIKGTLELRPHSYKIQLFQQQKKSNQFYLLNTYFIQAGNDPWGQMLMLEFESTNSAIQLKCDAKTLPSPNIDFV